MGVFIRASARRVPIRSRPARALILARSVDGRLDVFPRNEQVGAGVLGLLGLFVEQMPDTPAPHHCHRGNTRHTGNNNDARRAWPCTESLKRWTNWAPLSKKPAACP